MALEKWRRRGQFGLSISVRDTRTTTNPNKLGFIIESASQSFGLTTDGTSVAGTVAELDLSGNQFRIPVHGTILGTASVPFGTVAGGANGQISTGFNGASAQLGVIVGGTVFVLNWPVAGGAVSAIANPPGA